jgi:hypothetical protein
MEERDRIEFLSPFTRRFSTFALVSVAILVATGVYASWINVPSLRGLSTTAPYFHDGRYPDLASLIPAKLKYLEALGSTEKFSQQEIDDLLAYLGTL